MPRKTSRGKTVQASKRQKRSPKRPAARRRGSSTTARRKSASRKTSRVRRTLSTARRKTAVRAAATRQERQSPAPESRPSKLAIAATNVKGALAGAVAVVGAKLPWGSNQADALALLETDHRHFETLLREGEETTERARKRRTQLVRTLAADISMHELMEEQVLYPALKAHPEAKDIVLEGYQEHHVADMILKELEGVSTDDEQWAAKFKVLKENLEHHIQEEEGKMFRTARGIFGRNELREMAEQRRKLRA